MDTPPFPKIKFVGDSTLKRRKLEFSSLKTFCQKPILRISLELFMVQKRKKSKICIAFDNLLLANLFLFWPWNTFLRLALLNKRLGKTQLSGRKGQNLIWFIRIIASRESFPDLCQFLFWLNVTRITKKVLSNLRLLYYCSFTLLFNFTELNEYVMYFSSRLLKKAFPESSFLFSIQK